ncbi:MSHA biogenesis protein MshP [Psychromonas sp.]|nr:MSHA biogenesis protein MshP [Psychromonas sp.]
MSNKSQLNAPIVGLKRQSGGAILIAIFVVIVIALLGSTLVSLQRDSAKSVSFEVYAARAYLSAYSGSEMALTALFPVGGEVTDCNAVNTAPTLPTNNIGFHACSVSVSCSSTTASAGVATRYKVVSTAICESGEILSRRQITVEAADL